MTTTAEAKNKKKFETLYKNKDGYTRDYLDFLSNETKKNIEKKKK